MEVQARIYKDPKDFHIYRLKMIDTLYREFTIWMAGYIVIITVKVDIVVDSLCTGV
jgi:hypothetical protein